MRTSRKGRIKKKESSLNNRIGSLIIFSCHARREDSYKSFCRAFFVPGLIVKQTTK
uniref:Uncharacterized protein n=1 Tax=Podoviridae sp. ctzXp5 TaxID=2827758 RepID=A0A8S5TDX6_9CAUD|nr:MAG TPA: hypothetical protein [Podoviridae sp. ctzXp5]DAY83810.1 MAG TPA: hypothetical protein [Caudoviricetes sp.]